MNNQDLCSFDNTHQEGPLRWIFVKNMMLKARIGVYPHEHNRKQNVRISVYCATRDDKDGHHVGVDKLERTVSYDDIVSHVQDVVEAGHVELTETLAEKIAAGVLADKRVLITRISVEKLDVIPSCESVGVVIQRRQ